MAFLVSQNQRAQIFMSNGPENYYPAFLNHITNMFRGTKKGTLTGRWENQFYDTIVAYPPRELPAFMLNEAFVQWSRCDECLLDQPLTGVITEASPSSIQAAEPGLMTLLFPSSKPSKGAQRKAAKAAKKVAVGMAAAAVTYGEANSLVFMGREKMGALPEVGARQQQEQDEDDEDEEDDGEDGEEQTAAPVSFGELVLR